MSEGFYWKTLAVLGSCHFNDIECSHVISGSRVSFVASY